MGFFAALKFNKCDLSIVYILRIKALKSTSNPVSSRKSNARIWGKSRVFYPNLGQVINIAIKRRIIDIDTDTGQIYKDKTIKFSNFNPDRGYLFRSKNQGIKTFADLKLSEQVTDRQDFTRCHLLAEHIYKETNMISVRYKRDIRAADIEDISCIINLSVKKAREFLNRMRKLHIIAEREDKIGDMISVKYYFNPLFFCSSKYLSPELYFLFQESLDVYIPGWARQKFHELGNIKRESK